MQLNQKMFTKMKLSLIQLILCSLPLLVWSGGDYSDLHATSSDRSVIANLFEWRFDDIAEECETFLGPYGYAGVQISPVLEYAKIVNPWFEQQAVRPWYERYQPVSYKIISRSGNETELRNMVSRCNKAGVRVFVDLVLNHMTGELDGVGSGGSEFKGQTDKSYPGVPFTSQNFHSKEQCGTGDGLIHDYGNANQVRNCELSGLHDLDQSQEYVRSKQIEAVNRLIDIGVGGFRLDASKHMWPTDLKFIFDSAHNLNTEFFPQGARPLLFHEVMPGGAVSMSEYTPFGRVCEFNYRRRIVDVFRSYGGQQLKNLKNWGEGWGFVSSNDAVPMVDNHDLQRSEVYNGINFRQFRALKMATAFMLSWPYGIPSVMSSYDWEPEGNAEGNKFRGPPMDSQQNIQHVVRKADMSCVMPWKCEHRWRQIYNMVRFRNAVGNEPVANWWDNNNNVIAFSRGSKGFIVIVNQQDKINQKFATGLPSGSYCDIISGNVVDKKCTGKTIEVDSQGNAEISIDGAKDDDPMVAIHVDARTDSSSTTSNQPKSDPEPQQPSSGGDAKPSSVSSEDEKTLDYCALCAQSLAKRKVNMSNLGCPAA